MKPIFSFLMTIFYIFLMSNDVFAQGDYSSRWEGSVNSNYWNDIDGNEVEAIVYELDAVDSDNEIEFWFVLSTSGSWWKGIKIFDKDGNELFLLEDNKQYGKTHKRFDASLFDSEILIEFWKAKAFGVHTHVASKYIEKDKLIGRRIKFFWRD